MSSITRLPLDRYNLLVEFAVIHLDFQEAELSSVLDMYGITIQSPDCLVLSLPPFSDKTIKSRRAFTILSFPECYQQQSVTLFDKLRRCTLIRSAMELWGLGTSLPDCVDATRLWRASKLGSLIFKQQEHKDKSWKTTVHTLGMKFSREQQDEMRQAFRTTVFDDLKGPVKMEDPDNEFLLLREVATTESGSALRTKNDDAVFYFGRLLGPRGRSELEDYNLKKRVYLGPTSMDAELSFIMSNLGQAKGGAMVMDPFVGTGSILLSCALRGAYCVGTDIDLRVLRGRSSQENVAGNFAQYGLPRPELVRSDNALYDRHFCRSTIPLYDAIITDPPYGIRAGARQTGTRRAEAKPVLPEHRHDHIAQTKPYPVSDVMADLLDMAARTLVMGGRLVFVIPSFSTDFDVNQDLPQHPCLELLHSCYQPFTTELGRRIVTMKKTVNYDAAQRPTYLSNVWKNGPESAEKCANIRDKILEAAKQKPGYEQRASVRKEKRKQHKVAKKEAKKRSQQVADVITKEAAAN